MREITMIYREVISKRLKRKRGQFAELEKAINSEGVSTPIDKRRYIELKAVVNELETVLDIADSMFEMKDGSNGNVQQKDS